MSGIVNQLIGAAKKLVTFLFEYSRIAQHWTLKFFKTKAQGWTRCSARKRLDKACADLGMDVYSAYKQGQTGWENKPSVQQHLRSVEAAEMGLFNVDDTVRQIDETFQMKKEAIHETYAVKRAGIGRSDREE